MSAKSLVPIIHNAWSWGVWIARSNFIPKGVNLIETLNITLSTTEKILQMIYMINLFKLFKLTQFWPGIYTRNVIAKIFALSNEFSDETKFSIQLSTHAGLSDKLYWSIVKWRPGYTYHIGSVILNVGLTNDLLFSDCLLQQINNVCIDSHSQMAWWVVSSVKC